MKIKKIMYTLSLISILGGISTSMTGCGNGEQNAAMSQSIDKQIIFLHSKYIETKYNLQKGHIYTLSIIDNENNEFVINQEQFSCNEFETKQGCKINLPAIESKNGSLSIIIYDKHNLVAAASIQKSSIQTGLRHIYFNENTTGEYIFDQVLDSHRINTGSANDYLISPIMEQDSRYDNYDIEVNVKFFLLYKTLEKDYGDDTIYYIVDIFNPDVSLNEIPKSTKETKSQPLGSMPAMLGSSPIIGCSNITESNNGTTSCNKITTKEEVNEKLDNIKNTTKEKGKKSDNIKTIADTVSGLKDPVKKITTAIIKDTNINISEETKATIYTIQTTLTALGAIGNIWFPGLSSALAGMTNGILDSLVGENSNVIKVNPMAKVEAVLGNISNQIEITNGKLNAITDKLTNIQIDKSQQEITKIVNNLNITEEQYTPLSEKIFNLFTSNNIKLESSPEANLSLFLNKYPSQVSNIKEVFNNSTYKQLEENLDNLVPKNKKSLSAIDTYLSNYNEQMQTQLDRIEPGMTFDLQKNRITTIQYNNIHLTDYMLTLLKPIIDAGEYYKLSAYLKFKEQGFSDIKLSKYDMGTYEQTIIAIDCQVQCKKGPFVQSKTPPLIVI